jgi:hypothetical protein
MTKRFWVVGGEYLDPNFHALVPGTEKMSGPFQNEAAAKVEWTRLTCCPDRGPAATTRFSIAAETVH